MKKLKRFKIARRLGAPIFEKTQSSKFSLTQTKKTKRPPKLSEYAKQLLEKQKARFTYGMSERQFSTYVKKACAVKADKSVGELFKLLESRLDNVVYRSGIAKSRESARQIVTHGHITINGKKLNIPSHQIKVGDVIGIRPSSKSKVLFNDVVDRMNTGRVMPWIKPNPETVSTEIMSVPNIKGIDLLFNINSVIEFYNR